MVEAVPGVLHVRLIYTDEAGTSGSSHESVRIVASIIVQPDREFRTLESEIKRISDFHVPYQNRQNFHFHAKDIFNGARWYDRERWKFEDRLDFFKEILSLMFVNDIPISVGVVFKDTFKIPSDLSIKREIFDHCSAFAMCVERADAFLQKYLGGDELGTIIAEDVPERRKILSHMGLIYRDHTLHLADQSLRPNRYQRERGEHPLPVTYNIRNIIDVPHFVEKGRAPLLQLADASAFAFRRCLSRQPHGNDLIFAMLGPIIGPLFVEDDVWFSGVSSGLFNTDAYQK